MSFFLSSCFSFQTRADVVLVKFFYNAAVSRKLAGKRLWYKLFLENFKLFKVDSGKGVFLSVFRTTFYGRFQTLKRNAFLWIITLLQILQSHQRFVKKLKLFLINCPEILRHETFLFSLRANFMYFLKCNPLKK